MEWKYPRATMISALFFHDTLHGAVTAICAKEDFGLGRGSVGGHFAIAVGSGTTRAHDSFKFAYEIIVIPWLTFDV